ncbi:hypothetical protein Tco_0939988 [Tanacetum coccineum]|uniref:Uncharacterized protein n=1 Tax=Tanacetum coccineum TaxID=301880 RepID=A0ABQ5DP85_9ASTR
MNEESLLLQIRSIAQRRQECSKEKEETREECQQKQKDQKRCIIEEDVGIKHYRVSTAKPTVITALEENSSTAQDYNMPDTKDDLLILLDSVSTKQPITAVGEKVNAAESLLVVSTEVTYSLPSTEPTIEPQPSPDVEYHVPTPNESPLHAVYSHGSAEGSLKLNELMTLVTKLSERIGVMEDDLKKTKLTYSAAVTKLILRVKKLETQVKAGTTRKSSRFKRKQSTETEPIIKKLTSPLKSIQDQGSSEKGKSEVSTARSTKGKASESSSDCKGMKKLLRQYGLRGRAKELCQKPNQSKSIYWKDP